MDIKRQSGFWLSYDVIDLTFDRLIVELSIHGRDTVLRAVVARHQVPIHKPSENTLRN